MMNIIRSSILKKTLVILLVFFLSGCTIKGEHILSLNAESSISDTLLDNMEEKNELPIIETEMYSWSGYLCVIPEGFVVLSEKEDVAFTAVPEKLDSDKSLWALCYTIVEKNAVSRWDNQVFSPEHIKLLLSTYYSQEELIEQPLDQYEGYSLRIISDDTICYHVYERGNPDSYMGFAKVEDKDETSLIVIALTFTPEQLGLFDSIIEKYLRTKR